MRVTEVRIRKLRDSASRIRAFASVTLDGQLVIHNIRVVDGNGGLFIAMPRRKLADNEYKDVVHPIDTPFRDYLQTSVLEAYEKTPDAGQTA